MHWAPEPHFPVMVLGILTWCLQHNMQNDASTWTSSGPLRSDLGTYLVVRECKGTGRLSGLRKEK